MMGIGFGESPNDRTFQVGESLKSKQSAGHVMSHFLQIVGKVAKNVSSQIAVAITIPKAMDVCGILPIYSSSIEVNFSGVF